MIASAVTSIPIDHSPKDAITSPSSAEAILKKACASADRVCATFTGEVAFQNEL